MSQTPLLQFSAVGVGDQVLVCPENLPILVDGTQQPADFYNRSAFVPFVTINIPSRFVRPAGLGRS